MNLGQCVLAIDIGTTSVRVAIVDASGTIRSSRSTSRPSTDSGISFDPLQLWSQLAELIVSIPTHAKHDVIGIGITAHVGTVLADVNLNPVGTSAGWSQTAGVNQAVDLIGGELQEILSETGRPKLTGGGLSAALALKAKNPELFGQVAHVLSPKDYLIARMTGEVCTDHTSAAYTGASNVKSRTWSTRTLDLIGLDQRLFPRQLKSTDPVGQLRTSVANLFGLPADTLVYCGGPDGSVGATYVVGERRNVVADVAGTTDMLLRVVDSPSEAPVESVVNPYTLGSWSAGGATGSTGGAISQWAHLLGLGSASEALARLGGKLTSLDPGSAGLSITPSFSGSRFPRWNPAERGMVSGMSDVHKAEHFILAVAEGAAYVAREGVDLLAARNRSSVAVILAGGVARSSILCQLRSDVLNREILVSNQPEVSLLGAGMLAWIGSGAKSLSDGAEPGKLAHRISPDPRRAERYETLFREWRAETPNIS